MKTSIMFTLATLVLAAAPASSFADHANFADHAKKKPVQTQIATANQQVSIKHLHLRAAVLVVNQ
jgi:hypothetical protein